MSFTKNIKPLALACAVSLLAVGCSEDTTSNSGPDFGGKEPGNGGGTSFDEKALIANLVDNVMTPTFEQFSTQANTQLGAIKTYCDAEKANQESLASLDAARQQWQASMALWQHAEMMQMGPLTDNDGALRNLIYSWPAKSLCGVDQDVAYYEDGVINLDPNKPYDIKNRTATRRGLVSLEHLLFNPDFAHNCSSENAALSGWNERPEQARRIARCEYAIAVAQDISDNAALLLAQWKGDTGFANEIKSAGQEGNQFESVHQAVNVISDAMFYADKELKDYKLATPLGYFSNSCGLEACPEDVESSFANASIAHLKANLDAFELLFTGKGSDATNTTGFDDFLVEEEAAQTSEMMLQGLVEAKAAVDNIDGTLKSALAEQPEQVEQTHAKVKAVTDQLKNDFINKLALELPKSSAGDND